MTATLEKKIVREDIYSYPKIRQSRNIKASPAIGFEWEVPYSFDEFMDEYECVYDRYDKELDYFCSKNGFRWHTECGGIEFASPVSMTISQARMVAKVLQNYVSKAKWTNDPESADHCCGIHVTVSPTDRVREVIDIMPVFLHSLNYKFLWELSGREDTGDGNYSDQASPCGFFDAQDMSWDYDYPMTRDKGSRLEVRMFGPRSETLIPAIEFTHSVCKFLTGHRVTKKQKYELKPNDMPTGVDYYNWLMKKPGYATLKSFAPWSLIDDIVHT